MINNGFHPHVWFKNNGDVFKHNCVFTEHKDIRLQGWGKEVDHNLFADRDALILGEYLGFKDVGVGVILKGITETTMNVALGIHTGPTLFEKPTLLFHLSLEAL